jgi:hypothetical protein
MKLNLFEVQDVAVTDEMIGGTLLKKITIKTNSLKGLETFEVNCFLERTKPEPINGTPVLTTTQPIEA